jgi:hypothetical protein
MTTGTGDPGNPLSIKIDIERDGKPQGTPPVVGSIHLAVDLKDAAAQAEEDNHKRKPGDQDSRFEGWARFQIVMEYLYLAMVLLGVLWGLLVIFNLALVQITPTELAKKDWLERALRQPAIALVAAMFLSGMAGGTAFTVKWLYHTVAKDLWFRDRLWWRLSIPWMGGLVGVFANFIFSKALGTQFDEKALDPHNFFPACGLSFLIGVFADGTLASLEKLANKTLGTLNDLGGP